MHHRHIIHQNGNKQKYIADSSTALKRIQLNTRYYMYKYIDKCEYIIVLNTRYNFKWKI